MDTMYIYVQLKHQESIQCTSYKIQCTTNPSKN